MEDHPPQLHRTRVLKLQPNCCTGCVMKVKRAMLKAEGVHLIKVNAKEGTIEVKSEIDPQVLIEMAAKACKRAELLWDLEPESSQTIPTPAPHKPESSENRFDHTVNLQDLVDKNARGIKHMKITDKRVIKIKFKEPHDDPSADHSRVAPPSTDSKGRLAPPSKIAPPSSDSKGSGSSGSDCCGNVEVVATPAKPSHSIPSEISDAPCNSKPLEPPVANVICSNGGSRCHVM